MSYELLDGTGSTAQYREHRCIIPTTIDGADLGLPEFDRGLSSFSDDFISTGYSQQV